MNAQRSEVLGKVFEALTKTMRDDEIRHSDSGENTNSNKSQLKSQVFEPPKLEKPDQKPELIKMERFEPTKSHPETVHADVQLKKACQADASQLALNEKLITHTGTSSIIAESFRRLRNRILHPSEGLPVRSILVTSVVPEEGKSFVCANLGITVAQGIEQHALIIDGDLRRPTLANLFGVNNDRGLANHLQEGTDIGHLIQDTGLRKLSIIPSGPPPSNPAELLNSEKMASMIAEVVDRYQDRFILIDSPPISAASETSVLSKFVDGVVIVVRWGYSKREQIKQLVDGIGHEKIIGIIFNAFEKSWLDSKVQSNYYDYDNYYSDN